MRRLETLRRLSAALAGSPMVGADWRGIVEFANEQLVTPQLRAALRRRPPPEGLTQDLEAFMEQVLARNRQRNARLFAQLRQALSALNAAGLEPTLLKGAALWVALDRPPRFDRMLQDLDILVEPHEAARALEALSSAGFQVLAQAHEPWRHVVAELGRPTDVGVIDLHHRPPGPVKMAGLARLSSRFEWEGVCAWAPEPAAQVVLLALHDQFHDGAYWRGDISLRHLLDIAALGPRVDWSAVDRLAGNPLVRRAVAVQVAEAERFAGLPSEWAATRELSVRLQHLRRLAQVAWPSIAAPLAWLAALSEAANLLGDGRVVGQGPGGLWARFTRFQTLASTARG